MRYLTTEIEGIVILEPNIFGDSRGYFFESFRADEFKREVSAIDFVQDNESFSRYGVVRGLHFQRGSHAQAKLVRAVRGSVLDVAVDLRADSSTRGRWVAVELNDQNHKQIFIPRGFAHGFAVLSESAVIQYKCDNYYAPEAEDGIAWDDPDLAIDWLLNPADVILSAKDLSRQSYRNFIESSKQSKI